MRYRGFVLGILVTAAIGLSLAGCNRNTSSTPATGTQAGYPAPRYPSYLKRPESVEAVLPYTRPLARNKSGLQGKGLGVMERGETCLIVTTVESEDMVVEGVVRALQERGVKAVIVPDYELVGVTKAEALDLMTVRRTYTSEQGYMEATNWIDNNFADPEVPKKWLAETRPDLYALLYPKNRTMSPHQKEVFEKMKRDSVGPGIRKYLEKHPDIKGVYWGKGGGTGLRRALYPLQNKFLGTFTADNRYAVMNRMGAFPGDVWQLIEEQAMEPIVYTDRIEITDPEGTNVWAELTPEMAARWSKGAYQRGHLYMFPNQATGRFAYSVVNYPAFQDEWLPREPVTEINGVLGGVVNHTGVYPHWKVHFERGNIVKVEGGGVIGDALQTFLKYPKINELVFPYHKRPGFWYLYEIAFGTQPKAFRNWGLMQLGQMSAERERSGVLHWGLGIRLWHDPSGPTESQSWLDFTKQYNMPRDHGFHTHTYFTTYKVRLRNANRWVTLVDKGHLTGLDSKEVRALASRYGNPDDLLAEDWIPEIPGINVPGDYEKDYAANPWKTVTRVINQAETGQYPFLYPPVKK